VTPRARAGEPDTTTTAEEEYVSAFARKARDVVAQYVHDVLGL